MEDCIADCAEHYKLQIPKMQQVQRLKVLLLINQLMPPCLQLQACRALN